MYTSFPDTRLRRLRIQKWLRTSLSENNISVNNLVLPIFIQEGSNIIKPIDSLPGVYSYSLDTLNEALYEIIAYGIPAITLLPRIENHLKDDSASEAYNHNGLIPRVIKSIKKRFPGLGIISDVSLAPYTVHGYDGIIIDDTVDNDITTKALISQSLIYAEAGASMISPSDMMDGRIGAIRRSLDKESFENLPILSHAATYASALHIPMYETEKSKVASQLDKKTYQMHPANLYEALRESSLDINEGADIIMVKPASYYLDVVSKIKQEFNYPMAVFHVSGEYAMIKAAVAMDWLDFNKTIMETMLSFRRAGADMIFTYAALEVAKLIKQGYQI